MQKINSSSCSIVQISILLWITFGGFVFAQQRDLYTLHLLPLDVYPRAVCLDGSPGGFYVHHGDPNLFVMHWEGGGWCTQDPTLNFEQQCTDRANGINPYGSQISLGGSAGWARTTDCSKDDAPVCDGDGGNHGLFSASTSINPRFANATKVFVGYCSGDSYAGSRDAPFVVGNQTMYFRGLDIRRAVMNELLLHHGMDQAETVLLGGTSAGGLAIYFGADDIAAQVAAVNPQALVLAVPGAGFFLDFGSFDGLAHHKRGIYQWLYTHMNMTGVPSACYEAFGGNYPSPDGWKCLFPQYLLASPGIPKTPSFVVQSLIDAAQVGNELLLPCDLNVLPGTNQSCSAAVVDFVNKFRQAMLQFLQPMLSQPQNGGWLLECVLHCLENFDQPFSIPKVDGQTQHDTLAAWFDMLTSNRISKLLPTVVDGPWDLLTGGNPTCKN